MRQKLTIVVIILSMFMLCACSQETVPEEHVQINEPLAGDGIYTAEELLSFIEKGEANKATLAASISLDDKMIKLALSRNPVTIDGNGYTLSGTGDCVIRLESGCSITLENIEIIGGFDAVGCLGDASITAHNTTISSVTHCINAAGIITLTEGSAVNLSSNVGSGLSATGLILEKNSTLEANGDMSAVIIKDGNVRLQEKACLKATTKSDYNALKCDNTVFMKDGSELNVANSGNYHGAEVGYIVTEGIVTIKAHGGSQGVGLFLFSLENKIYALGECVPPPRFEVGKGELVFMKSEAAVKEALAAEEEAASNTDASTEASDTED